MLKGKVAFITGSTRGIGWAAAKALAAEGAAVIINGISDEKLLQARAQELRALGGDHLALKGDAANPEDIQACYRAIFKKYGRLDVLVNNAGIMEDSLLGMLSYESLKRNFEVNAIAVITNMQAASRLMMRNREGSIINVSSVMGIHGNAGQTAYGGAKAAVIGATKSASKELAPHIRVNAVAPGFIETDMVSRLAANERAKKVDGIRMGRPGLPEEVADAIVFLASKRSSYVTGQVLVVDGGMTVY